MIVKVKLKSLTLCPDHREWAKRVRLNFYLTAKLFTLRVKEMEAALSALRFMPLSGNSMNLKIDKIIFIMFS
jgi:hypothetical protein